MRCFAAVDVTESVKKKAAGLQIGLQNYDVKLVPPENMHFTLKFFGEVDEEQLQEIKERLKDVADKTAAFSADVKAAGAFPSENYIRVLWVGSPTPEFHNLHVAMHDVFAGSFQEKLKPVPHLTIARVRSQQHKRGLKEFLDKHKDVDLGKIDVNEVKLKKSTLSPKGPVYEDVEVFEFQG